MNDPGGTLVAVYIDFDNIVLSRYDQVNGRSRSSGTGVRVGRATGHASRRSRTGSGRRRSISER